MKQHETRPLISERAAALTPYTPGEQPQDRSYIKLNTNENPYPPAPSVQEYLRSAEADRLRLYPDPESTEVRMALSETFGLSEDSFFLGNGSDEVLSFIFYAFFDRSRGPLLFPEHTYSFYPVYCSFYDIPYRRIPLTNELFIDPGEYRKITETRNVTGIIFPNPNAPTGAALSRDSIEELMETVPGEVPIVIDEAYVDFGADSCLPLIGRYGNLIVVHTFSKNRSLAGMRIGYAAASEELIRVLNMVKNSFNSYPVNRIGQEVAVRALRESEYFEECRRNIMATRERTVEQLRGEGWYVVPSKANFFFTRHPELSGKEVYTRLKEDGILVRYFGHKGIEDFVRISIGTEEEMERLVEALRGLRP